MRNRYALFFLLCLTGLAGCRRQTVTPSDDYTSNPAQVKSWLPGRWQLTKVYASAPNPVVPNVQLLITNDHRISVVQDGKQTDDVTYELVEMAYGFTLKTTAQPRGDNWYIRDPALRIARNRLFLDTGMAADLPGFIFERVNP